MHAFYPTGGDVVALVIDDGEELWRFEFKEVVLSLSVATESHQVCINIDH